MFLDFVAMYVSGEMKLGYFWRFEIPGAIARLLPGNHEKPSSVFIFMLKEVRTRCGVAEERFRKAPQAKDVPRIFGNFKSPVSPHFHAAAHRLWTLDSGAVWTTVLEGYN